MLNEHLLQSKEFTYLPSFPFSSLVDELVEWSIQALQYCGDVYRADIYKK